MKSRLASSNQIVELQPQREQGRTHLFQLHNAEKGQAKPWTTNGKLAIRGRLSMGCHGSTMRKQRGSWMQGLPGLMNPAAVSEPYTTFTKTSAITSQYGCRENGHWKMKKNMYMEPDSCQNKNKRRKERALSLLQIGERMSVCEVGKEPAEVMVDILEEARAELARSEGCIKIVHCDRRLQDRGGKARLKAQPVVGLLYLNVFRKGDCSGTRMSEEELRSSPAAFRE
ncbi:uncharacterized protein V6R79_012875 [Siganus canaliculatus]